MAIIRDDRHGGSFCPICWGQGRIFEPAANGEGLIPVPCGGCMAGPAA